MATEHVLDPVAVSPDQFTDCAQALVHTILFHRSIDTEATPWAVRLPGVDIAFASAESPDSTQQILSRHVPMQTQVFSDPEEAWIILSLSYNVPKRGWFRNTIQNEIWERWCVPFTFATLTAQEIRDAMLDAVALITRRSNSTDVPGLPDGATFAYALRVPGAGDADASPEFARAARGPRDASASVFS